MNATSPQNETDATDQLFSDFFKAQLKQPWPKAPMNAASTPVSEPSELVTTHEASRIVPSAPTKTRDNTARARFTLAASVAMVLCTCWFLADGFQPDGRVPAGTGTTPGAPTLLHNGGASGKDHAPLKKIEQDKAKGENGDIMIDLGKGE